MENEVTTVVPALFTDGIIYESFINTVATGSNYYGYSYLRIGDNSISNNSFNYICLRFQVTDVVPAGAKITSARLKMYLRSSNWVGQSSSTMNLRRFQASWLPHTITYANRPSTGSIECNDTRYGSDTPGFKTYFDDDAAFIEMIQDMLDNPGNNWGFRLSGSAITPNGDCNAHNYMSRFGSQYDMPVLEISYIPDGPPAVESEDPTSVTHDSVTLNGHVDDDGGAGPISMAGFIMSDSYIDDFDFYDTAGEEQYEAVQTFPGGAVCFLVDDANFGSFPIDLSQAVVGLDPDHTYYYKALAWNSHPSSLTTGYGVLKSFTTKAINATVGAGGQGKTHALFGSTQLGWGGDGGGRAGALFSHTQISTGGAGASAGNGSNGQANTGSGGGGAGPSGTGGSGGSGLTIIRYKTEDAISAQYVTDAKAFNPSIAFQRGKLFTPYYASGSKVTVGVTTIGSGSSPVITCADDITGLENGMGVTIVNSGTAAINGNWIVANVDVNAGTFTITPGADITGNSPTGCLATFNAYVGIQDTSDLLAPIGWLKTSRSAMEMLTIKKKFKYISVIHEPFESDEYVGCGWTLDGTEATGVPDIQSPTETIFPIHDEGYSIDVTLSLIADSQLSISPKVTAVHVVWSFVKNKVHQYSLLCVKGANGGRWNKNPKKAIQFLFANAGDVLTFEERFAGTYQGTIDAVDFNQGQASLSDDASGLVRLTVVEET